MGLTRKFYLKLAAALLLLFNSCGALYGGWLLIADPTGSKLQMPLTVLQYSPFTNFLIPGVVLFFANGVFGILTLGLIGFNAKYYPMAIIAQGAILTGWIVIQMFMLHTINPLQITMGITGISLLLLGYLLIPKSN
ncbi:MAG: hypothetical protein KA149_03800 [Chitinophagales bacterium]|nr:hypothetical protein [Chitinophagales bacterium]